MPKDPTHKPTVSAGSDTHPNLEEEIRRRAYELYEERCRLQGNEVDDWLRAEAEITGRGVKASAA